MAHIKMFEDFTNHTKESDNIDIIIPSNLIKITSDASFLVKDNTYDYDFEYDDNEYDNDDTSQEQEMSHNDALSNFNNHKFNKRMIHLTDEWILTNIDAIRNNIDCVNTIHTDTIVNELGNNHATFIVNINKQILATMTAQLITNDEMTTQLSDSFTSVDEVINAIHTSNHPRLPEILIWIMNLKLTNETNKIKTLGMYQMSKSNTSSIRDYSNI
jgi:hypothetical protein